MPTHLTTAQLKAHLETAPGALALLDVRDTAEYNLAHIPGSCSLPRRLLEYRARELVPYLGAPTVVCDDDGRRAALAAATLTAMGYTDVSVLAGGLNRWVTDGESTEWGVNVPSKDFGEKVLLQQAVPEVDPDTLNEWLQSGRKLVMLDSRTPEEHHRSCIPGSCSMPGAELGLRVWDLIEDKDAPVVVHCAGRTRSIIGAATLQRLGVPNVYALKNGTMGWLLAGLQLETGSQRLDLPSPSPEGLATANSKARDLALRDGVRYVDPSAARAILARAASENVYALDVRSREEYAAGHIPGFRWAPGGQVVQATDSYIAVRDGTILLACDGSVRASMTGAWLRQLGHANVFVLDGGVAAWRAAGLDLATGVPEETPALYDAARRRVASISPADASKAQRSVIYVGTSEEFAAGHLPGSSWLPRGSLELLIEETAPSKATSLLVTCKTGVDSTLAAATLLDLAYPNVVSLAGGTDAWQRAGLPLETGLTGVTRAPNDVLPSARSYAEMLNYLRWEEDLGHKYGP